MTPQDSASTWLGLSLQDWTNVATIIGAIGTFIVAIAALLVSVGALRTQREALPVSAMFDFEGDIDLDDKGLRWVRIMMQNTGVRAYVHEVYLYDWQSRALPEEQPPIVARIGVPDSLPEQARSKHVRELGEQFGVFQPEYLPTGENSMFYVSCPPGIERIRLAATMSIRRRGQVRFVCGEWLEVPTVAEVLASDPDVVAHFQKMSSRTCYPPLNAEGAEG